MDVSEKQCQYIFQNLIEMLENPHVNGDYTLFINRLLQETPQCDKFSSLNDVRGAYVIKLHAVGIHLNDPVDIATVDNMKDIRPVTHKDKKLTIIAINHHKHWTQNRLLSCLTTRNWIYYQIRNKYKKLVSFCAEKL